jgi:glucose-6-phosphate 1-epimerase
MRGAITQPDRRFEIPGVAEMVEGNGGLSRVRVSSAQATGEIYLLGANLTSWKPAGGDEVFFVSSQSRWEDGRAIRGGIPICFPWFGAKADDPRAPAHGFVRTKIWQLESIARAGEAVTVSMFTESSDETKKWWPAEFRLVYRVTFGSELRLELEVSNTGESPLRFEEALHAYLRVADARQARVKGLDGVRYFDKTDSNRGKIQQGDIEIASETDRVYLDTSSAIELDDPLQHCRIRVAKENSRTTVVWNPWIEKARSLSDLGEAEWTRMVCIEASNVSDYAVSLAPGERHTMKAIVTVGGF